MTSELLVCSLCGKNLEVSKNRAICPRCTGKPAVEIYYYRKVTKDIDTVHGSNPNTAASGI